MKNQVQMAKIECLSSSKTTLKISFSPKLTKNHFRRNIQSKQLSIWLSIFRKDWSEECPKAYLEKLLEDNPIIKKVRNTVLNFRRLMKEKQGDKLKGWCDDVINDENENIKGFARGVLKDYKAVYQGFVSNWSSGPVEGQVNRLKNIKRQMYGRAGYELLRKRVVITSQR